MSKENLSFSFHNDKIIHDFIGDGVFLRMKRIGHDFARVYFADKGFAEVPVQNDSESLIMRIWLCSYGFY